jgi:hypothetical protein
VKGNYLHVRLEGKNLTNGEKIWSFFDKEQLYCNVTTDADFVSLDNMNCSYYSEREFRLYFTEPLETEAWVYIVFNGFLDIPVSITNYDMEMYTNITINSTTSPKIYERTGQAYISEEVDPRLNNVTYNKYKNDTPTN